MTEPLFVLVRPQMGENVGAAARAMWNFRLSRMALVAPRDGWPNPKAVAMASGAGRVLDGAVVAPTVADAAGDADVVFATTARDRDLTKEVLTPEEAMRRARALIGQGRRVAVLFGPERAGLENDDVARANAIVSVPVNPEFPSLNLAQCVLLMAYEWGRSADTGQDTGQGARMEMAGTEPATAVEVERLAAHWEERLGEAGFFFPEAKAPSMRTTLRNLWSRMPLTRSDVQILHGMLRQLVRGRGGVPGGGDLEPREPPR